MSESPEGKELPEDKGTSTRARLTLVLREYRPVAWLVFLTTSLVLFLAWMPAPMRVVIWNGLAARGTLSSMLFVFSLMALSLVWSAGQRIDVWAFLFFNLRKSRPLWLDRIMLGFTNLGSGLAAAASSAWGLLGVLVDGYVLNGIR